MVLMLKALVLGVGLLAGLALPAVALDARRAELVVGILEQFTEATGDLVYLGGAGDVFEYDMDNGGNVAAAGFDYDSWIVAFDEVMTGYMATIPQDEFDAIFAEPLARLAASTALSEEDKAVLLEDLKPEIDQAYEDRKNGSGFVDTVRPLMPRLRAVVLGD